VEEKTQPAGTGLVYRTITITPLLRQFTINHATISPTRLSTPTLRNVKPGHNYLVYSNAGVCFTSPRLNRLSPTNSITGYKRFDTLSVFAGTFPITEQLQTASTLCPHLQCPAAISSSISPSIVDAFRCQTGVFILSLLTPSTDLVGFRFLAPLVAAPIRWSSANPQEREGALLLRSRREHRWTARSGFNTGTEKSRLPPGIGRPDHLGTSNPERVKYPLVIESRCLR